MRVVNIEARIHGRVVVRDVPAPTVALIGFHGYMESADLQMARLTAIPGAERWTLVAAQALHRFYRGRSQETVAGWMTRQDRELMIADNLDYVDRVLEQLVPPELPVVAAGFSQGVAMAFRAAVRGRRRPLGLVVTGGDVPPELFDGADAFPRVLLARGGADEWYTARKLEADAAKLLARGTELETLTHAGGHEWHDEFAGAVSRFIERLIARGQPAPRDPLQ